MDLILVVEDVEVQVVELEFLKFYHLLRVDNLPFMLALKDLMVLLDLLETNQAALVGYLVLETVEMVEEIVKVVDGLDREAEAVVLLVYLM